MKYDWVDHISSEDFSKEYFVEIDERFFKSANFFLPSPQNPFHDLMRLNELSDKSVLEIGVGNGSHAQVLAEAALRFTGIDLTEYATESTKKRMEIFGLSNTEIFQMNAESLKFPDNSFDLIWSWGVVHHSANTRAILKEIHRTLKPNGRFVSMVYHRGWWNYYLGGLLLLIAKGGIFRGESLHKVLQDHCDGAMARFYSNADWVNELVMSGLEVKNICVKGMKPEILPIPHSKIKSYILSIIPDSLARFGTNRLKMGSFLISESTKK